VTGAGRVRRVVAPRPGPKAAAPPWAKLGLLTLAGATAAAWAWNRRDEEALRARTAARLRPFDRRGGA